MPHGGSRPILHKGLDQTIALGVQQTHAYRDRCAADEAHRLIFDRTHRDWSEKVFRRHLDYQGLPIEVWGM